MSVDLLYRAAEALRKAAAAATPGPWVNLDGGDRLVRETSDGPTEYVVDEPMSHAGNADYIALLHPPVALALAETMERVYLAMQLDPRIAGRVGYPQLVEVAAAVLREEVPGG